MIRHQVDVRVHIDPIKIQNGSSSSKTDQQIAEIHSMITALTKGAQAMATDLSELTSKVEENATVTQSAVTLLNGLKEQLDAAGTDPAALAELSRALGSNSQALVDAITANTPSSGETPEQLPA